MTEEIISDTAVGHRVDDEFWGAEAGEDLNKSSDVTPKEHLFCHGLGCLDIWPKIQSMEKPEKTMTNAIKQ